MCDWGHTGVALAGEMFVAVRGCLGPGVLPTGVRENRDGFVRRRGNWCKNPAHACVCRLGWTGRAGSPMREPAGWPGAAVNARVS